MKARNDSAKSNGSYQYPAQAHSPTDAGPATSERAAEAALLWPPPGAGTAAPAGWPKVAAVRVRRALPRGMAPVKRPLQGRAIRAADTEPAPGGGDAAVRPAPHTGTLPSTLPQTGGHTGHWLFTRKFCYRDYSGIFLHQI